MRTIYKYRLERSQEPFTIDLPRKHVIIAVMAQGNQSYLWAEVETSSPSMKKKFLLRGSGQPFLEGTEDWHYVGSSQTPPFVWHLYEEPS